MAKMDTGPSKEQQLRWQAEDIVRQSIQNTPSYKKAVNATVKQLKTVQKQATKIIKGKKK